MAPEEICQILKSKFGEAIEAGVTGGHPHAKVASEAWPQVARFLKTDGRMRLNLLRSISAIDLLADEKFTCVYDLMSVALDDPEQLITTTREFAVRIEVDRGKPVIPSVADVWPAADWHEREAYDMMGIEFSNHPDFRRILCPDDWTGHPLRKDYEFPLEYHGIPATTEYELTNPKH